MEKKKSPSYLPLLPVILTGIFFFWILLHEHRSNIALVGRNEALLETTIRKSLAANQEALLSPYPKHTSNLADNWQEIHPDFYWFKEGVQVFPFLHRGQKQSRWDETWKAYTDGTLAGSLGSESSRRIELIRNVEKALASASKSEIRSAVSNLLAHKSNFRLTTLEEVASSLKLVEIDKDKHWNREFVNSILLTGWPVDGGRIFSVADLLLLHNQDLSIDDINIAYGLLSQQAENANLSLEPFSNYMNQLDSPFKLAGQPGSNMWIQSNNWLVVPVSAKDHIVIPMSPLKELEKVESLLKQQGVLAGEDTIALGQLDDWIKLSALPIQIDKPSWELTYRHQRWYLYGKMLALFSLLGLAIFTVRTLQLRIYRKQTFLQMREDFVNLISHEMKTPLTSISLMAETLNNRLKKQLDPMDYPMRILNESDRMGMMVDNVLSFNRFQAGMLKLRRQNTEMAALIDGVVEEFSGLKDKKLQISHSIPADLQLNVDTVMYTLVLRNLLSNSTKYNDKDIVDIQISYDQSKRRLIFQDNGIGVPEESREAVFNEFFRGEQTSSVPGTGLGLALSRKILRLHGGDLTILSSNENGTCWVLELSEDD